MTGPDIGPAPVAFGVGLGLAIRRFVRRCEVAKLRRLAWVLAHDMRTAALAEDSEDNREPGETEESAARDFERLQTWLGTTLDRLAAMALEEPS